MLKLTILSDSAYIANKAEGFNTGDIICIKGGINNIESYSIRVENGIVNLHSGRFSSFANVVPDWIKPRVVLKLEQD
ncbi:MAG TPA: hypothetical protein VGF75_08250 [Candidatus Saccharimonadales bacterium]|jgi:hypothetical protein